MPKLVKRESINVVIGEYQDKQTGQTKKQRKQIGERLTFQGDDGSHYAIGKLWGPHGVTEVSFYEEDQNKAQNTMHQPQRQPARGSMKDEFGDEQIPF